MTDLSTLKEDIEKLNKIQELAELCHDYDKLQERLENIVKLTLEDRFNKLSKLEKEIFASLK